MLKLIKELKRRKVLTTLGVYGAAVLIIIQVADIVLTRLLLPDWTVTFIIILLILGFPVVFFFSWTYDLKRESEMNDDSVQKSKKMLLPITGFLTLIGGAFWLWYGMGSVSHGSGIDLQMGIKKSIAILAFENHSGSKDGDFFCSALTEQVRASLSKLSRLDVKSRLSSKKIKKGNIDSDDDLYIGIDYYVEGTLSRAADNKNINISLINAKNQSTKWSAQYTFAENEILQYQDTILNNIAQNLDIDFDPVMLQKQKEVYKNSKSFKLIGEGIYNFDNANYKSALVSFNAVLDIDPDNINAQFQQANTLSKLERFDDAIHIYSNLLKESRSTEYINWTWELPRYENVYPRLMPDCFACRDFDHSISFFKGGLKKNQDLGIFLLYGVDESRLVQLNIDTQEVVWSEKIPDNNVVDQMIINDKILLTSNHFKSGFGESAIYAYDINTGMKKFIHEFPRGKNRFVTLEIIEKYNKSSQDSLSILVLKTINRRGKNWKEVVLLDNNGNEVWNVSLDILGLNGRNLSFIKKGSENFLLMYGNNDIYKINIKTGVIVWRENISNINNLVPWGEYVLGCPWDLENASISLWDPIKEKNIWNYKPLTKIHWLTKIDNDNGDPLAIISTDNGELTALNMDPGWFGWNPVRWSHSIGSKGIMRIHKDRVFYLTDENALLTFDRDSGEKINEIELDYTKHSFLADETLNPLILKNKKFIMGIDPLNGDQLWKIKELSDNYRIRCRDLKMKLFEKNLLVVRPLEKDSIILINNYRRDDGNLMWSQMFDLSDRMYKWSTDPSPILDHAFDFVFSFNDLAINLMNYNDQAYLILQDAIIELDLSYDQDVSHIEPKDVRMGLAKVYAGYGDLDKAEIQYKSVIEQHDQMSREAHWELAKLYSDRENNNGAVASLLKYYDLVVPDSREAGQTLQKLKEITPLRWSQNIYSYDGDYLFVEDNKIFRIKKSHIEMYRLGSGALLNKTELDENTKFVFKAILQDNLYLITRVQHANEWAHEDTITAMSSSKYHTVNLISINKNTGDLLYNNILDFSFGLPSGIKELTVDDKYIYTEIVDQKSWWFFCFDKTSGKEQWRVSFERPSFYSASLPVEAVYYKEKIFLPINNKIIYLNREDGKVLGEYNIADVEQITTFNQPGLNDNMLTFIIEDEDVDFNLVTINLDSGKLIDRQISDYDNPSIKLNYNNHLFDLNNYGRRLSAYSFVKDDSEIALDWEKNYNQSVSLIGQENGLLYLFDQADNSVFSIKTDSGEIVKKKLPLLWPAMKLKIYQSFIIVQSDGHLYVIKNI